MKGKDLSSLCFDPLKCLRPFDLKKGLEGKTERNMHRIQEKSKRKQVKSKERLSWRQNSFHANINIEKDVHEEGKGHRRKDRV